MHIDQNRQLRTLVRYRFMFRASLAFVAVAALMFAVSLVATIVGSMPATLPISLLLIDLGAITAYKIVNSTARILDVCRMRDLDTCGRSL